MKSVGATDDLVAGDELDNAPGYVGWRSEWQPDAAVAGMQAGVSTWMDHSEGRNHHRLEICSIRPVLGRDWISVADLGVIRVGLRMTETR